MHPLLPDKVEVRDAQSTEPVAIKDLSDIIFEKGTAVNISAPEAVPNLLYTLGVGHAGGQICLYRKGCRRVTLEACVCWFQCLHVAGAQ